MLVKLAYENSTYFQINSMSVIGSFNQFNPVQGTMSKQNNQWIYEVDLLPGEYLYRLLVNNTFELNDPSANLYMPDEQDRLWSMVMINQNEERLFNPNNSSVVINNYWMFNRMTDEMPTYSKKQFNLLMDKQVAICFEYVEVIGINTVTIIWYDPIGQIIALDEQALFVDLDKPSEVHQHWHLLPFDIVQDPILLGTWHYKLFVNGQYILEDHFEIQRGTSYSSTGHLRSF